MQFSRPCAQRGVLHGCAVVSHKASVAPQGCAALNPDPPKPWSVPSTCACALQLEKDALQKLAPPEDGKHPELPPDVKAQVRGFRV